jgi:hypothetical protein
MGFEELIGPLGPLRQRAQREEPDPVPWAVAAPQLVEAAIAKDIASKQQHKAGQQSAQLAIDTIIDDYCGTPPRRVPWPHPGPPPWAFQIAAELSLLANTLQPGGLKNELESIAGRISHRGGEQR